MKYYFKYVLISKEKKDKLVSEKIFQVFIQSKASCLILLAPYVVAIIGFFASLVTLMVAQKNENKRFLSREKNEIERQLINKDIELAKYKTKLNFEVKHKLYSELIQCFYNYDTMLSNIMTFLNLLKKDHSENEANIYYSTSIQQFHNRIQNGEKMFELTNTGFLFYPVEIVNLIVEYNSSRVKLDNAILSFYNRYSNEKNKNWMVEVNELEEGCKAHGNLKMKIIDYMKKDLGLV